jgi:hypothetical protein
VVDGDRFRRTNLQEGGFQGFVSFRELRDGRIAAVPDGPGIYVMLRESEAPPLFLQSNPGGRFKGRDPTVAVEVVEGRWVESAHLVYVGKADRLRRRLRQFADFGAGKPVGHWGGRYVWQLEGSADLVVAWRETPRGLSARGGDRTPLPLPHRAWGPTADREHRGVSEQARR